MKTLCRWRTDKQTGQQLQEYIYGNQSANFIKTNKNVSSKNAFVRKIYYSHKGRCGWNADIWRLIVNFELFVLV
jgi:hypothetical protein